MIHGYTRHGTATLFRDTDLDSVDGPTIPHEPDIEVQTPMKTLHQPLVVTTVLGKTNQSNICAAAANWAVQFFCCSGSVVTQMEMSRPYP